MREQDGPFDVNTALSLIIVLVLVAANAFFVAVEFSLVAADRQRLQAQVDDGNRRARVAMSVVRRMSFHLSGAQLGITITSLLLGALAEPLVARWIDPIIEPLVGRSESGISIIIALLLATVFQMVIGELIPKNIAIAKPNATALVLAPIARIVHGILSPSILLFNGVANWMVRKLGIEPQEELTEVRSLEEIEYLIRSSGEEGTISPDALSLLERTIKFGEKTAADVLVPRVHIQALSSEAVVGDLIDLALESGHTRFPVFGEDIDDILGVVVVSDVFALPPSTRAATPITELVGQARVVPETRDLEDLLSDFRGGERDLFIVSDEHGGTDGILTLEDVLEEITGEIDDEFDDATTMSLTTEGPEGVTVVAGTLHGDEVEEACGFEMPEGEYETIAGFLLNEMGQIPRVGDDLVWGDWRFEVISMDRLRIASVEITNNSGEVAA